MGKPPSRRGDEQSETNAAQTMELILHDGRVGILLVNTTGLPYWVESSVNLVDWSGPLIRSDSVVTIGFDAPLAGPMMFFRVVSFGVENIKGAKSEKEILTGGNRGNGGRRGKKKGGLTPRPTR